MYKLYGGTYPNAKLYEWNGVDAWVEKAPKFGSEIRIKSVIVFNNNLYGSSTDSGKLLKWNKIDSWIEVAPQFGSETTIELVVFDNKLYGGSAEGGKLLEWNGVDAWVEKAPKLGDETKILSLAVFNDKLYGGTYPNAKLYEWNGVDAWVEKAPQLGSETYILSLATYNNKLYGGTGENGKLYEWNGVDAWVEKAPQLGSETYVVSLITYDFIPPLSKYDTRRGVQLFQVAEYTLDVTVTTGTSQMTHYADVHGEIGYLGFSVPQLATAGKTARLQIWDVDGYEIYDTTMEDASVAKKYSYHVNRLAAGKLKFTISTDANVTGDKDFEIKWRVK